MIKKKEFMIGEPFLFPITGDPESPATRKKVADDFTEFLQKLEELSHGKIKATSTGLALVWDPNPVEKGGGA